MRTVNQEVSVVWEPFEAPKSMVELGLQNLDVPVKNQKEPRAMANKKRPGKKTSIKMAEPEKASDGPRASGSSGLGSGQRSPRSKQ